MTTPKNRPAILALEDGTVFRGEAFGAEGERVGEVVFNTSMTGYQEILTDPSYCGQIVTMTYPLIGNYGINREDVESQRIWVEGFVVRELSRIPSNWRHTATLDEFLVANDVPGIQGIDTRMLTKHLRTAGALKGIISSVDLDEKSLVQKARDWVGLVDVDMVQYVTCAEAYHWDPGGELSRPWTTEEQRPELPESRFRVAAIDTGIKTNILRRLRQEACDVTVFPAKATANEILAAKPDGVFLANGPGDPAGAPYVSETIRGLLGKAPIFGICLGHQMLGLACGGTTYKLKFGHRGANQPVLDTTTGKIEITAQNHGFAVDIESLPDTVVQTHLNLNDRTSEGLEHKQIPAFSVQYHPEASPGPHDAAYLFPRFIKLMERNPVRA
jgi:carbamoyl-phosphate synthase small subunit